MKITHQTHDELKGVIEDTIEYFCDQEKVSGILTWTVVQCLATARLAEMNDL